jgi:hypothetical protein
MGWQASPAMLCDGFGQHFGARELWGQSVSWSFHNNFVFSCFCQIEGVQLSLLSVDVHPIQMVGVRATLE